MRHIDKVKEVVKDCEAQVITKVEALKLIQNLPIGIGEGRYTLLEAQMFYCLVVEEIREVEGEGERIAA